MSKEDMRFMGYGVLIVAVIVLLFLIPAHGADRSGHYAQANPELHQWFNSLRSPTGGLCCSMADGHAVDDPDWDVTTDGEGHARYRVVIDGEQIDVPDGAVVQGNNRIGRAIVWPIKSGGKTLVRCFLPGALT